MLVEAKRETGLPIITEVMSVNQLPLFEEVDILPNWSEKHAKLRPSAGGWQTAKACAPEAGTLRHFDWSCS